MSQVLGGQYFLTARKRIKLILFERTGERYLTFLLSIGYFRGVTILLRPDRCLMSEVLGAQRMVSIVKRIHR